jgi:hypothetical protein
VQSPTETLPAGLDAWQRLAVLYQTHALALKKLASRGLAALARMLEETK